MSDWVLASSNLGKLAEFNALFAKFNRRIIPQSAFTSTDAVENGLSFVENALIKARHASQASGLPAIADDSGLCVPLLDNAPGLYSARFAGVHGEDSANNDELLKRLQDKRVDGNPQAFFVCVLVFVRSVCDPLPVIAQGLWQGEILPAPQGQGGFGYDPLFWLPNLGKTAAELDPKHKNALSHRGQALDKLVSALTNMGYC